MEVQSIVPANCCRANTYRILFIITEREERLAREREENEARQKVEEERLAKLEAIAQKQRQRDQEIEARLAAKSEGGESGRVPFKPREGAGGWREREAAKAGSFMKKTYVFVLVIPDLINLFIVVVLIILT